MGYRECLSSVTLFEACSAPVHLLCMVRRLALGRWCGGWEWVSDPSISCCCTARQHAAGLQVQARERVRAAVEEALGVPLLVEFTGLLAWRPGSSIAWHTDANRPYLRQREYAAVAYLNDGGGADFEGGELLFQGGDPPEVTPRAGRVVSRVVGSSSDKDQQDGTAHRPREGGRAACVCVQVAYSARDKVHSVRAVTAGERYALTLWFTTDPAHDEDQKLIPLLPGGWAGGRVGVGAQPWRPSELSRRTEP